MAEEGRRGWRRRDDEGDGRRTTDDGRRRWRVTGDGGRRRRRTEDEVEGDGGRTDEDGEGRRRGPVHYPQRDTGTAVPVYRHG